MKAVKKLKLMGEKEELGKKLMTKRKRQILEDMTEDSNKAVKDQSPSIKETCNCFKTPTR